MEASAPVPQGILPGGDTTRAGARRALPGLGQERRGFLAADRPEPARALVVRTGHGPSG